MKRSRGFAHRALILVVMGAVAATVFWLVLRKSSPSGAVEKVSIAYLKHPGSALLYVAQEKGFFLDQGIEMTGQPMATGKQALDLMLQDKVDLSIVADLPLVFSVAKGHKPMVLATVFRDHGGIAVVARRDRGITSPGDLRGKRVGVTFGTSTQFFFDAFLMERQIPTDSVTLVDLKFEELADAIINGQVDAACTWDPALGKLQEALKDQGLTFDSSNQYTYRLQLVASEKYLLGHKDQVRRFLAALAQAEAYIAKHPAEARILIQQGTGMNDVAMKRGYDLGEIGLLLDQGLLLALDDQTRWAMKRGVVKSGPVPNYLDNLYLDALKTVKPEAVTLTH
jgi:ABC-type nitrate/sulfonate/bicarbonate transport system substrate-binding protein